MQPRVKVEVAVFFRIVGSGAPYEGDAMLLEQAQKLTRLTGQLTETLMTAAICAAEIGAIVRTELAELRDDSEGVARTVGWTPPASGQLRPVLNISTLCVHWSGRSLHLGQTLAFRLLDRLARQPNQYVTHLDLLRD